jgi:hypothetical protein
MSKATSITMTAEQTAQYDMGGEAARQLMERLRIEASKVARTAGATHVEIYTADGITADAIDLDA